MQLKSKQILLESMNILYPFRQFENKRKWNDNSLKGPFDNDETKTQYNFWSTRCLFQHKQDNSLVRIYLFLIFIVLKMNFIF